MKKTIKDDQERIILGQQYLDDNNLLEYRVDDREISLSVRYIENNKINEIILTKMLYEDYINDLNNLVKINDNNTAVAIYKRNNNEYYLRNIYKTEDHSLSCSDFIDIEYDMYFNTKKKTHTK